MNDFWGGFIMKKFFAVMLLAVGIIFGSQVADVSKASAADVYAYTEGGVEYYVTGEETQVLFLKTLRRSSKA